MRSTTIVGATVAIGIAAVAVMSANSQDRQGVPADRNGITRVGELAPDFTLETVDKSAQVTLSSYRGERPVALIFGSYT